MHNHINTYLAPISSVGVSTWTCHPGLTNTDFMASAVQDVVHTAAKNLKSESLHPSLGLSSNLLKGFPKNKKYIHIHYRFLKWWIFHWENKQITLNKPMLCPVLGSPGSPDDLGPRTVVRHIKMSDGTRTTPFLRFQTLPGRSQWVLSGHNSEVGFWRVHKSR